MTWNRRAFLRALAASTGTPAMAGLLQACGGAAASARRETGPPLRPPGDVRAQLRETVTELATRFDHASALLTVRRRGGAAVDPGERTADRNTVAGLVLVVASGDRRFERAIADLDPASIEAAARQLRRDASAISGDRDAPALAAPVDHPPAVEIEPSAFPVANWLERVDALYERARRIGGSRIVYRGAYVTVDDTESVYIGDGRDLGQRIVRTRAGLLFVTQTGAAPTAEAAQRSGTAGLETLDIDTGALHRAAERALSLLTPRPIEEGPADLLCDPSVAGLLADHGVARPARADCWLDGTSPAAAHLDRAIAAETVTITDDPTVPGGFGSYAFDDEGIEAEPTAVVDAGVLRSAITDATSAAAMEASRTGNGRRSDPLAPVAPRPSNVAFGPGDASGEDMLADMKRGYVLEGGLAARLDPASWTITVRVARAREVVDGKLTGQLFGNVAIRGSVPEILGSVRAVGADLERHGCQCSGPDGPVARSTGGPPLLTRATVAGGGWRAG